MVTGLAVTVGHIVILIPVVGVPVAINVADVAEELVKPVKKPADAPVKVTVPNEPFVTVAVTLFTGH